MLGEYCPAKIGKADVEGEEEEEKTEEENVLVIPVVKPPASRGEASKPG